MRSMVLYASVKSPHGGYSRGTPLHGHWPRHCKHSRTCNALMAESQDEHVVAVVVATYSVPAHAVHVSVAASVYLWPAAQPVHVLASLHASQLLMAEAQAVQVPVLPPSEYSPAPHATQVLPWSSYPAVPPPAAHALHACTHTVQVSVAASVYLWPTAQPVHVLASLHASQLLMAEAQVAGVPEFR